MRGPTFPPLNAHAQDSATVACVPICGDNIAGDTTGETCDGTDAGTLGCSTASSGALDSCRANCTCCGDGHLDADEQCDGAAFTSGVPSTHGPCREDCTFCGDSITNGTEMCDDGNTNDNDTCSNNCTNGCGNGILNTGEHCDGTQFEAGAPSGRVCRSNCTYCGDGIRNGNEQCDDGNSVNADNCRNDCTLPLCGDGILDAGEHCDGTLFEANAPSTHGPCRADCTYCGDATKNGTEMCDDGNTNDNDTCSNNCTNGCGNGILNTDEHCDGTQFEAGAPSGRVCRSDCTYCGDGIKNGNEQCDDGNNVDTDSCRNNCTLSGCSVTIAKTVAPDEDCNGIPDSAFVDDVTVDKIECVIYKVCITNAGGADAQSLNASDVTLNDSHIGITNALHLDFGTLAPGQTACKEIPSTTIPADSCPNGQCICQDVEGKNTASVSNVICAASNAQACLQSGSKCSDDANVGCSGGCRITAGRTNRTDGSINGGVQGPRGQGGGQVGAPCGCTGCFTTGDPQADDAFEHIQGNWQYDRKYPGATQFKQGTFHAKQFNSLICGCCSEDLPNCTNGTPQTTDAGICFRQGATSDPLNGKICGDRTTGPLPRPAAANIICFSGIGDWTDTNGHKNVKVAFRVEAEDRGEPSTGKNSDDTCDYHRIRIWVPKIGEDAAVLADQACCTTALDSNLNVPGIRRPDIDDGGNLIHGNIQIHPETPNSNNGRCPVPDGSCQQP
ncbi:MAG: DUF4215 domain-containing protein [Planctomycetes bacterium]|nr:DUF4215 domain-containing protein [Planctomycetota bacterium]